MRRLVQLASPLLYEARAGRPRTLRPRRPQRLPGHDPISPRPRRAIACFHRADATPPGARAWKPRAGRRLRIVIFCSSVDRDQRRAPARPGSPPDRRSCRNCVDTREFAPRSAAAFASGGPVVFIGTTRYPTELLRRAGDLSRSGTGAPDLEFWIVGERHAAPARIPATCASGPGRERHRPRSRRPGWPQPRFATAAAPPQAPRVLRGRSARRVRPSRPRGWTVVDGTHVRLGGDPAALVRAPSGTSTRTPGSAQRSGASARALVEVRYDWRAWCRGCSGLRGPGPHLLRVGIRPRGPAMDEIERFSSEVRANVDRLPGRCRHGRRCRGAGSPARSRAARHTHNFSWLWPARHPAATQDLLAVQELIWQVRPDLIVETGIAHGGSLIHSASLLEILRRRSMVPEWRSTSRSGYNRRGSSAILWPGGSGSSRTRRPTRR
mgnify:CR=1 FL=1